MIQAILVDFTNACFMDHYFYGINVSRINGAIIVCKDTDDGNCLKDIFQV